jgi:type II secretory pathway pseudopilin PulG
MDLSNPKRSRGGSALIALIAAILIFSVLAAALLPMISS